LPAYPSKARHYGKTNGANENLYGRKLTAQEIVARTKQEHLLQARNFGSAEQAVSQKSFRPKKLR